MNGVRLYSLTTWFYFLNIFTIAVICLIFFKIYKVFVLIRRWIFQSDRTLHDSTILVLGPKNEMVEEMILQISKKFDTEIIDFQDFDREVCQSLQLRLKKGKIIYRQESVNNQDKIIELSRYISNIYGHIDVLVMVHSEEQHVVGNESTDAFFDSINRELLTQFSIVMTFLPGMMRRNSGHIISISLCRSSLANTGIMRTIQEDLLQGDSNVRLTLVERNTFLENYLPTLPNDLIVLLILRAIRNSTLMVRIPSLSSYFIVLPILMMRLFKNMCATLKQNFKFH